MRAGRSVSFPASLSLSFAPVLIVLLFMLPTAARAVDEFSYDLRLLRALRQIEMYDYAALQAQKLFRRYPDQKDRVLFETARVFYAQGKRKEGDAAVAKIAKNSRWYVQSRLVVGEMSYRRRDLKAAAAAYAEFFKAVKQPDSRDDDEVEDFKRAVQIYSRVLQDQGKGSEAAKVMAYLERVKGEGGASDRQLTFLKAQSMLAAEEAKLAEDKPVNTGGVQKALKDLSSLQFELDGVAAASFVERARGYVILGENQTKTQLKKKDKKTKVKHFIEAIKVLKMATAFMTEIESALGPGARENSPIAGALTYKGKALYGEGVVAFALAGNKDKARKLFLAAAKYFETAITEYGNSPYRMIALTQHGKCGDMLEKRFGETIETPGGTADAELEVKMEQAMAFLASKDYAAALPHYLDAFRSGRRSRRLPEVGVRLVLCYGNLGRYLEGEAVVSYLSDLFSQSEDTAQATLMLGGFMHEASRKVKDKAAREKAIGEALGVLDRFVELSSTHPKAPEIAFMIAENQYRVASEVAKSVGKTPAAEREKVKAAAREAYMAGIPKYQRLVDQFSSHEKGIRALYKLGWIYYSTDQPEEAADAFLRYCESESLPNRMDDRLEAKFRAAEQMMLHDDAAEAVEQFGELISWLSPGSDKGFNRGTAVAKRVSEDSACYLAWSYDLAGEAYRPELTEFKDSLTAARQLVRQAEKGIEEAEQQVAAARKEAETTGQRITALIKQAEGETEDGGPAPAPEQDVEGETEEEREAARRIAQDRARQLAAEKAKQSRQQLEGARLGYERDRDEIKTAIASLAKRRPILEKDLAEATAALKQLRENTGQKRKALTTLEARIQTANAAVETADENLQKYQRGLQRAKEMQASEDPETSKKGRMYSEKIAEMLKGAQAAFDQATEASEKVATDQALENVELWKVELKDLDKALHGQEGTTLQLEREVALAEKDTELLTARLLTTAKALERNAQEGKVLALTADARKAADVELAKMTGALVELFRAVQKAQADKAAVAATFAEKVIARCKADIAAANERIAKLDEGRKPVRAEFDGWKEKAEAEFVKFLKNHPKSKHIPANMARLGTVYLEQEDFPAAAQILNRLATQFPQSDAGKEALFNLGRAQFEIGKFAEAEAAFDKLLKRPADMLSPNLGYISETMLGAGRPKASLAASRELLARSEDKNHPDAELLQTRSREHCLFRAAQACGQLEDHAGALTFYGKLLEEKPNTAYFFESKFGLAEARRQGASSDLPGAIRDVSEVLQYATDPVMMNRGLCRLGQLLAQQGGQSDLQAAAARFQQVVMLADASVPGNAPWIEMAVYESARTFARLGDTEQRDSMVKQYRRDYAKGKYRADIGKLPAAGAGAAPAPPAAQP